MRHPERSILCAAAVAMLLIAAAAAQPPEAGQSRCALPEETGLAAQKPWRVIAFTQERQGPRIIERGKRETGGYVALWLDDPRSFRWGLGGTVPKVEEVRVPPV